MPLISPPYITQQRKFGDFHQGFAFFQPLNGFQCTAVALLALFMFMQHMPNLSNITSNDINQVIIDGTDLYRYITHTSGQNGYISETAECLVARY